MTEFVHVYNRGGGIRNVSVGEGPTAIASQANLAVIGVPVPIWLCGMPFVVFAGDGASNGLAFTGTAGGFTLSATPMSGLFLTNGYAYLPANAGGLGNTAGWYYFTMSSETAGIVYNNNYTPGNETTPSIPAAPVPFSNASAIRITQETAEVTALQRTLNAGSFSPNSIVTWTPKFHGDGSANAKQIFLRANGVSIYFSSRSTSPVMEPIITMRNLGSLSRQLSTRTSGSAGPDAQSSITGEFTSVDTAQAVVLTASLKIAAAGTTAVLYPGAASLAKGV